MDRRRLREILRTLPRWRKGRLKKGSGRVRKDVVESEFGSKFLHPWPEPQRRTMLRFSPVPLEMELAVCFKQISLLIDLFTFLCLSNDFTLSKKNSGLPAKMGRAWIFIITVLNNNVLVLSSRKFRCAAQVPIKSEPAENQTAEPCLSGKCMKSKPREGKNTMVGVMIKLALGSTEIKEIIIKKKGYSVFLWSVLIQIEWQ